MSRETADHGSLLSLLHYERATGAFYWRSGVKFRKIGGRAGAVGANGHRRIAISGRPYFAHRLAWFYVHAEWPAGALDHINRDPDDNRIGNLRVADTAQNAWNASRSRVSKSGHRGVIKNLHKWIARIKQRGVVVSLGSFATKDQACAAFDEAAMRLRSGFLRAPTLPPLPAIPERIALPKPKLTAEILREMLAYDAVTGTFRWKRGFARAPIGSIAGKTWNSYTQIGVLGRLHYAHRLAWLYVYGVWPAGEIDHINGDGADNRIANLRDVTRGQNLANRRAMTLSETGLKGVERSRERWIARIASAGERRYLGTFDTPELAHAAYVAAARELHGEYARVD